MTSQPMIVLRRARIWSPSGASEPTTITLNSHAIEAIGQEPDPRVEAAEVDLDGRLVMSGLVDRIGTATSPCGPSIARG